MKCLRRYFCVLLCCLLSLGAFSVVVNAEEVDVQPYEVYHYHKFGGSTVSNAGLIFYPNNGIEEKYEYDCAMDTVIPSGSYQAVYRVQNVNRDILFEEDENINLSFNNVYYSFMVGRRYAIYLPDGSVSSVTYQEYIRGVDSVYVLVKYADGTEASFTEGVSFTQKDNQPSINIKFSFEAEKDVSQLQFFVTTKNVKDKLTKYTHSASDLMNLNFHYYSGEFNGDNKFQFSLDIQSEEAGWLESIWNAITDIPNLIWNVFKAPFETIFGWLGDIFNALLEIPKMIWDLIEAGLKALFVPSDSFIVEFKEEMDLMLSQKLGAVYQVIDIMGNSWDSITANDVQNVIHIPETTIPLGDNSFSFGGYDVPIVPSGFDFIVDILKTVIGISATVLFVNGLRKKYDDVIGGK